MDKPRALERAAYWMVYGGMAAGGLWFLVWRVFLHDAPLTVGQALLVALAAGVWVMLLGLSIAAAVGNVSEHRGSDGRG